MANIIRENKNCFLAHVHICLGTLSLYGGGWSWKSGVNWENAGITNDTFLNESI